MELPRAERGGIVDRAFGSSRFLPLAREVLQLLRPRRKAMDVLDNRLMAQVMAYTLASDSNCVDVGAFQGDALRHFFDFAPSGRHYAFEPIPELAARLRGKYPSAEVWQVALSETGGEATFYHVVTNSGYSGLRKRTYDRPGERIEPITVRTERLDDILAPDLPIDFVKVDVEGAELQVFRGAARTLKTYRPTVVFEHELGGASHYGTTPQMVYDYLVRGCGLRIFQLDGEGPMAESEFASVFERGSALNFLAHR